MICISEVATGEFLLGNSALSWQRMVERYIVERGFAVFNNMFPGELMSLRLHVEFMYNPLASGLSPPHRLASSLSFAPWSSLPLSLSFSLFLSLRSPVL